MHFRVADLPPGVGHRGMNRQASHHASVYIAPELMPALPSWLPGTDDALLSPLLLALQADPADNRSAADWAHTVHTTERTLARRFQARLGMGLNEWRQRLRVSRALPLLEGGQTVEAIAQDLGDASTSALIAMFRRPTGSTPDAFRRDRSGRCS